MDKDAWSIWASTLRSRSKTEVHMIQKTYESLFDRAMSVVVFTNKYTTDKFVLYEVPSTVVGLMTFDRLIARDYIIRRMLKLGIHATIPDNTKPFTLLFVWFEIPLVAKTAIPPPPPAMPISTKHKKETLVDDSYSSSDEDVNTDSDDSDLSTDTSDSEKRGGSSKNKPRKDSERDKLFGFFRKICNPSKIVGK